MTNKIRWLGGRKITPEIVRSVGGDWSKVVDYIKPHPPQYIRSIPKSKGSVFIGYTRPLSAKQWFDYAINFLEFIEVKDSSTLFYKDPRRLP